MLRVKAELLQPGDIILTATTGKVSKVVRKASKGAVSHAMLCIQHGSTIDSTDNGVQASNIQRELYAAEDTIFVLRLRQALTEQDLHAVLDFARSEVGTRYSKAEAIRTVLPGPKSRSKQMFCSRLIARAYAIAGVWLVADIDYCTPEELRLSPLLYELSDMMEMVSEAELAAWARRPDPIAETQRAQNAILDVARALDSSVENFNDLDRFIRRHPEHDATLARAFRETGYLDIWRTDLTLNAWHYDLEEMDAVTNDRTLEDLRQYSIGTIRDFHTGGQRYAVNLAHYERLAQAAPRETISQLTMLYRQMVRNDEARRNVALAWLRRYFPADAKRHLQRIVPHSAQWFSIIDRVEPPLGVLARLIIKSAQTNAVCSACGDPADDYLLVNGAETMPGVPSLRLCSDCVTIRRAKGEVLVPIDD